MVLTIYIRAIGVFLMHLELCQIEQNLSDLEDPPVCMWEWDGRMAKTSCVGRYYGSQVKSGVS
jgi:hypothetical protein